MKLKWLFRKGFLIMHIKYLIPLSFVCLGASSIALAEDGAIERTWAATAELGYIETSGNTETETLNAKFKGETSLAKWTNELELEALKSAANDVRSAEKYRVEAQTDYDLGGRAYALLNVNWENDNFSGYDYQAAAAFGFGYRVIRTDTVKLKLELGPGYRVAEDDIGNKEEDAIVRAAELFTWKLSETSTFEQYLKVEAGDSNTETRFGISLASKIAGDLSMKISHDITHNSDVPAGSEETDRETSVTMVYKL